MKLFSSTTRKQEILLIFCFLISGVSVFAQTYQIPKDKTSIKVYYTGKPNLEQMAVYVGTKIPMPEENIPPMLGRFSYKADTLSFSPGFPFHTGRNYLLVEGDKLLLKFCIPDPNPSVQTSLSHIFPSTDTVPANLLKMYLYFSAPMREGFAYQHVSMINEAGDTLVRPFLELTPELWDPHSQRLTLWFDPGRLKRDLIPNQDLGTPLEAGETYELLISSSWKDIEGKEIQDNYSHTFYVAEADRQKPSIDTWKLVSPIYKRKEPLKIHFGEAMDQALSTASLSVWKGRQAISGEIQLLEEESTWSFIPNQPWEAGNYQVEIEARLEDLAGNNLNRLFDRDIQKDATIPPEQELYRLTFKVLR